MPLPYACDALLALTREVDVTLAYMSNLETESKSVNRMTVIIRFTQNFHGVVELVEFNL